MKAFLVSGRFVMGHSKNQPFGIQFAAKDEKAAREMAFSDLGSRHSVPRRSVHIEGVKALKDDEITNAAIRAKVARGA